MTKREREERKRKAIEYLRDALPKGSKIVVVHLRANPSCSASVRVLKCSNDGAFNISHHVAAIMGERYNRRSQSVTITGCGMDKAFQIAYVLGLAIYDDGYAFGYQWA
jgi:ribosomal protein L32